MRAYQLRGVSDLALAEVRDPACGDHEVVLRTDSVSICSTDVSYFRGHLTPTSFPVIPGHELVGTVVEVGRHLRSIVHEGDRLTYWGQTDFGGLAQYRVITPVFAGSEVRPPPAAWLTERGFYDDARAAAAMIPEEMPARFATLAEPLTSVLRSLLHRPPQPGDRVTVLGGGPCALLAVCILRHHLATGEITVVESDPLRRARAGAFGAIRTVDPLDFDQTSEWARSGGGARPQDYVFDALPHVTSGQPGSETRTLALESLKPAGVYIVYGASALPQSFSTWPILAKGIQLSAAPFDVRSFSIDRTAHVLRLAVALLERRLVPPDPFFNQQVAFGDEGRVRSVFCHYGGRGCLKTAISFDPSAPMRRTYDSG